MLQVKRLVLDVLKPHEPDLLYFARSIAERGDDYRVQIRVIEMDDKTETLELTVEGTNLDLEVIRDAIETIGASLHSMDEVEVINSRGG